MRIDRIETAGPDHRARRIYCEGLETPRVTSAAAVRACGLVDGQLLETELDGLLSEQERPLAKDRALRYLGYRDRSISEVQNRLRNDGYPASVVRETVDRLLELSLLDDERFAATWCRSRRQSGYGPRRIRDELLQRGVDKETAQAALDEIFSRDDTVELARQALKGRDVDSPRKRDAALRRLISKGFDMSTALSALEEDPS